MVDTASALCDACRGDAFHHLAKDRKMRKRVSVLSGGDLDHYLLLYACSGKCLPCVQFWVGRGADLNQGTEHHSDWTPLEWALWSDAGSERRGE